MDYSSEDSSPDFFLPIKPDTLSIIPGTFSIAVLIGSLETVMGTIFAVPSGETTRKPSGFIETPAPAPQPKRFLSYLDGRSEPPEANP